MKRACFAGGTLALLLLLSPLGAWGSEFWMDYTDGDPVRGYDPFNNEGDLYTMRFSPHAPVRLLSIKIHADRAGVVELRLYQDADDFPNLDKELMEAITVEVEDYRHIYLVDLSDRDIVIDPPRDFHVGVGKLDEGVRLGMDSTTNWALRGKSYRDGVWHENHRDWFVMVKVETFDEPTEFPFTNQTEAAGITAIGSRLAWGDYDNDGDQDLLTGNILYRNEGDGSFTQVSDEAGISGLSVSGAVWGDFNNDGCLDFFAMVNSLEIYDRFLRNNCDGTFTDITLDALVEEDLDLRPTEGAAWGDYDLDGFLDIYIANYEMPGETLAIGTRDRLYHNNGDGTFTDLAPALGLDPETPMGDHFCGRGVNWGDFNDDGLPDIYVSNYRLDPNYLWQNNGDGSFTDVAEEKGVRGYEFSGAWGHTIGSLWGDFNNDGYLDLFNANLAHPRFFSFSDPSFLFLNNGPPDYDFRNASEEWQIIFVETNSDPAMGDWNNDGWADLLVTNVYNGYWQQLYRNDGGAGFTEMGPYTGLDIENGWGASFVDYDGDGDLDIMSNRGLFRNEGVENNWLQVRLECNQGDPFCVGARVELQVAHDAGPQGREIASGKGTTNGDPFLLHFGLNTCETAWRVTAKFLSGKRVDLYQVAANQILVINEDDPSDQEPAPETSSGDCALVDYEKPSWPADDDNADDDDVDDDEEPPGDDDASGDEGGDDDDDDDSCGC